MWTEISVDLASPRMGPASSLLPISLTLAFREMTPTHQCPFLVFDGGSYTVPLFNVCVKHVFTCQSIGLFFFLNN